VRSTKTSLGLSNSSEWFRSVHTRVNTAPDARMKVSRSDIISRCLMACCPNCGRFGMFKNWFRLNRHCSHCEMQLEKDESGFYFGTTSIGYVLAILLVIIPVCVFVVMGKIGMWTGVILAIIGSILLCVGLYPLLLCWVILTYYLVSPQELPEHKEKDKSN